MSASLNGTMSGMSVMSPEEQAILAQMNAVAQQQQQLLAQSTQAATQQAGQAQQQYQQAAQAPPPDLAALQLLSTLGGGLSEIMGNQGAAERQQQNVQQSRAAMLQARAQNLQSLRDLAQQKAEEAQRAGDIETAYKSRREMESLSKNLDLVEGNRKRAQKIEDDEKEAQAKLDAATLAHQRGQADILLREAEQRKTAGAAQGDEIQATIDDLAEGRTEITNVPAKIRAAVQTGLRAQGKRIMPRKVREALNEVGAAKGVVEEIDAISQQVNTAKANLASRGIVGIKNLGAAIQQQGLAADLETARGGLAGNLSRAIAAERGVLTDQDRRYAMGLVPTIWDSEPRARRKIEMLKRFIERKEATALKSYTTSGAGVGTKATTPATTGPEPSKADKDYVKSLGIQ